MNAFSVVGMALVSVMFSLAKILSLNRPPEPDQASAEPLVAECDSVRQAVEKVQKRDEGHARQTFSAVANKNRDMMDRQNNEVAWRR